MSKEDIDSAIENITTYLRGFSGDNIAKFIETSNYKFKEKIARAYYEAYEEGYMEGLVIIAREKEKRI